LYSSDISDENIKIANENLGHLKNLKLQVQDATNFSLNIEFDAIIMPEYSDSIPCQNVSKYGENVETRWIHLYPYS
jgi:hypothetical protein